MRLIEDSGLFCYVSEHTRGRSPQKDGFFEMKEVPEKGMEGSVDKDTGSA